VPRNEPYQAALPTLYGAPAYTRPRAAPVVPVPRPFDPDDLPLVAAMSDEERAEIAGLPATAWAPGGQVLVAAGAAEIAIEPSGTSRFGAIAGRLFGRA
jgi:hypothetical protein